MSFGIWETGELPGDVELIEEPSVRAAVEEWQRAREAARLASQDLVALEQTLPASEERDREAFATALEKNPDAKDPGQKHAAEHAEKIGSAQRRHGAALLVEQRAKAAMSRTFEEHGDEWNAIAEERLRTLQVEWLGEVDTLEAVHVQLSAAVAVAAFTRSGRFKPGGTQVPLRRSSEHRSAVADLLTALWTLGERPASEDTDGTSTATLRSVGNPAAA